MSDYSFRGTPLGDESYSSGYGSMIDLPDQNVKKPLLAAAGGGEEDVKGQRDHRYFDDGKLRRDCSRWVHRWRYAIWFLSLFAAYILYVVIWNIGWTGYGAWYKWTDASYPRVSDADPSAKVVLYIGDSLLNRPFQKFCSAGMVQRRLSDHKMLFWNKAQDGSTIASSYSRLSDGLAHNPQAVVLLWDSDASDVDESVLTSDEVVALRAEYVATLRAFVNTTLSYPSVEYMVMSGPVVYGSEGTLLRPDRFDDKADVYDEYREMNKQVCSDYSIDYIDARTSFLSAIPFYWRFYKWWISIDGEHFNYRGTIIWTNLLVERLQTGWLEKA